MEVSKREFVRATSQLKHIFTKEGKTTNAISEVSSRYEQHDNSLTSGNPY